MIGNLATKISESSDKNQRRWFWVSFVDEDLILVVGVAELRGGCCPGRMRSRFNWTIFS